MSETTLVAARSFVNDLESVALPAGAEWLTATGGRALVDISGDTLDNRRCNLRICTNRENARNTRSSKLQKSGGFKGVFWHKKGQKWEAAIGAGELTPNGKRRRIYLGLYWHPVEAARAYDAAALRHFGEFAAINTYTEDQLNEYEQARLARARKDAFTEALEHLADCTAAADTTGRRA